MAKVTELPAVVEMQGSEETLIIQDGVVKRGPFPTPAKEISGLNDIARFKEMERRSIALAGAAGRATMLPTGAFAFTTSADQERSHFEGGVRKGFYLDLAEDMKSARWHDEIPTSASRHWPTNSNTGTGAAVAFPTTHSAPDRFGGTGGGMLFTQGTTLTNGQRRFENHTESFVAGDIARVECFFSIISVTGAATFRPIRTRQISGTVPATFASVGFDADGVIDPASLVLPAANVFLRGRLDRCEDAVIDGVPVWKLWIDFPINNTGVMALAFDEPSALVASQIMIHEMRFVKNPKGVPSPLPFCQNSGTPAPDVLTIGAANEWFDVEFRRLARKHSRQAGNALQVPAVDQGSNRYAMSGPIWPYEDEIVIRPSQVATGHGGILPSRNAAADYSQLQLRKSWNLRAKGYFAEAIGTITPEAAGNIDLRGFSDTDLLEIPWVTMTSSQLELTNLRLDAVIYAASSQFTQQNGQVDVGANIFTDIGYGGNLTSEIFGMVSHPLAHSRARKFSFPLIQADGPNPNFIGTFLLRPDGASSTLSMKNVTSHGVGRVFQLVANGAARQITLDCDNWDINRFSSDGLFLGRGAIQAGSVWQNVVIRDSTYLRENYFQTAPDMPIWIDTGSGFESIEDYATAESLTLQQAVDSLPCGRRFQYYGYVDTPYTGSPDRTLADLVFDPSKIEYVAFSEAEPDNVGQGVVGSLTAAEPLTEGTYLLTITEAAVDAGEFQIVGPNNYFATGTVGTAFNAGGLSFIITLGVSATDFVVGDTIKFKVKRFDYDAAHIYITRYNLNTSMEAGYWNATGYQFHATNRFFSPDYNDNVLPHDSAWISSGNGPPSPGNPHLLVVRGNGKRDKDTGEWEAPLNSNGQPVLNNSGMHADPFQIDRTQITFTGTTFRNFVGRTPGQGFLFAPGVEANMFVGLTLENFFAAITGANAMLIGPGTVSATIDKFLAAPLWTSRFQSDGTKNNPGFRVQGGAATLTDCFVALPAINKNAVTGTGLIINNAAAVTGAPQIIRASQNKYGIIEPATPLRDGGVVTQMAITSLVDNPDMIENGYFSAKSDLMKWAFSPVAIRQLGFNPLLGLVNVLASPVKRAAFHDFVQHVLHQHPVAHGEMLNTAAVGDEIVLYDEAGAIVRLPGHTVDFHFGDGYGKDGPWRISEDGRVYLRWSLAGRDIFRRILTRRPDGEYGPIFTIDVKVA